MPPTRTMKKLLLALLASGVLLAAADLFVRARGLPELVDASFLSDELAIPELFEPDAERFWRLRAGNTRYRTGARATRGPCPDVPPDGSHLRIVDVGDSCTFGAGVRYEETYGVVLARLLQAPIAVGVVEPVLLACPGYSTFQSLRWLEQECSTLRPDVTVIEVGVWNDYAAAVGASDGERAAEAAADRAHGGLLRLWHRVFAHTPPPDREAVRTAFARGEAPFGRRVPLAEFRVNLRALITLAREAGSAVFVVVPPLPEKTCRKFPIALDYRAAVVAVAAESGATLVDAAAAFDRFVAGCPSDWCNANEAAAGFPLFRDWVHPSPLGHEQIARALQVALLAAPPPKLAALLGTTAVSSSAAAAGGVAAAAAATATIPILRTVEPATIPVLRDATLTLHGSGFLCADRLESLWIGEQPGEQLETLDDTTARITLCEPCHAGAWTIEGRTRAGERVVGPVLTVTPLELSARLLSCDATKARFELQIAGPPTWKVVVFGGARLRSPPVRTQAGDFALETDLDGRPADRPDLPFRFDRLELSRFIGQLDTDGRWRDEIEVDASALEGLAAVHLQGLVTQPRDRTIGALTELATVVLSR